MQELDLEIGKRLQKARKNSGYRSARAFARHHSIPESTYSQHETGKRSLSPKMVIYYCECFNINPTWLISGQEEKPAEQQWLNTAVLQKALKESLLKFSVAPAGFRVEEIVSYCLTLYRNVVQATEQLQNTLIES
jgi:transcriptional regulator with XRE-family HTH domain